jgi:hypothetical protein
MFTQNEYKRFQVGRKNNNKERIFLGIKHVYVYTHVTRLHTHMCAY